MSDLASKLADEIATDVMRLMDETGDDAIIGRVTKVLADQSQTLEEAFVVSLRVQMAARRAKALVARTRAAHEAEQAAAPAPAAPSDG